MPWEIPITVEDTTYPVRFNTEVEPTQADIDEAVAMIMQQRSTPSAPVAEQPGRLGSFASSVGRGALSVVPGTIGGIGYLTGQEGLVETAEGIEGGINRMLPVNPAYENEFLMKAGGALGQAGGILLTGGVTGAAGKALAASRGLEAAKGTQLARNVLTGTGVLQGARGGGQAAEQYGMQGGTAYARALLGGAIEGLSERALFGMGTELAPVKKFLGDAAEKGVGGIAKAAGTEAGEEAAAQIGGNLATSVLAPYGVQTPGALEGAGEAALLGGIAGGALGGVNALMQPSPTIEGEAMIPAEVPVAPEQPEPDEFGVGAFRQEMAQIIKDQDSIDTRPLPIEDVPAVIYDLRSAETGEALDLDQIELALDIAENKLEQGKTIDWARDRLWLPNVSTASVRSLQQLVGSQVGINAMRERVNTLRQQEAKASPDPIEPLKQVTAQAAETSVMQNADVLPATAAVIEAGGLAPAAQTPAQTETLDQVRARLRQRLSDEERAAMEQRLVQAEDEGILADVFAAEREKAAAREDFLRRQQDLEAERQRLEDEGILGDVFAEERQRATAREQQQPKAAETPAPEQPIPAVEEAVAPETTPEQVQNVENVIDEPGAAEVGLEMPKPKQLEAPSDLKAKGVVNLVGGSKDAKTFDKWLADQGVSDSQINPEKGDGGAGYLYLDKGTEKAGQFSWSPKSRTGVDSRLVFKLPDGRHVVWLVETQSIYEVDPAKIEPNPYFKEETAFEKPSEQMSPDEAWADEQAVMGKSASKEDTRMVHEMDVNTAVGKNKPVNAAAVDAYKITLPEGYVRQGDLFVFQPQPTTPPADATLQREIPENRVQERQATDEGGTTPEAGGRNIAEKGGQVEAKGERQEVAKLSRGKPRESIVFKKPVSTPLGDVIGYSWSSQLVEDVDKMGEPVLRRISNWEEAANNAETGRDIVHRFLIKKPDGTTSEVSLESTFGKMTDSDKKTVKAVVSAAKRLPFLRAELAELQDLQKQAEADYQRTQKLVPDPTKLELREPDAKWLSDRGSKGAYLDGVFLGYVESSELNAKGELANKAKFIFDNAWKWRDAKRTVRITDSQKDRAKSLTRSIKKAEDLLSRENVEVAKVTTDEQPTSLAEAGPPAAEMKTPSATADQPAPISQRPSLGNTGKQIIDAWRSLQGVQVAPGETVVGWDVNGGGTYAFINDKLVKLKKDNKGFESTYTDATEADWQDVSDALDRGALQVEVRKITGLGNYPKVDAGKTVKVLHQATGKPLQEFLDTPEGAAYEARMQKAVAERGPKAAKPAAEVETPVAGVTAAEVGAKMEELLRAPTKATGKPAVKFKTQTEENAFRRGFQAAVDKPGAPPPADKTGLSPKDRKWDDAWRTGWAQGQTFVRSKTPTQPTEFGSANTVVTKETKDKAVKSLRKKIGGQTNVGLDPSILKDAITIGAFYIEGGARNFADFSAAMLKDFGANVQKYIRPAYEALRKRTDIDTTGMDPEEQPETAPTDERTTQATLEDTTPSRAPTERQEAPAVQDQLREEARFPTEIKLTEQPKRPQAPVVPPDDKPVGFSNAEMDAEAERIVGRDLVRPVQEAISDEALWAQATAEFKRDPESGRRLVSSLTSNPRAVNSKEQAMLGMELVRRKKVLNEAAANFNAKPEGDIEAKSNYETAQRDYDDAMFANSIAGGDTARALRFRRLTANLDMELAGMLNLLRAVGNKADISKDQVAQTTEISEEYKKNRDELDALRKKIEERDSSANAEYLEGVKKAAFEEGFQTAKRLEAERVAEMQQRKAEYLAAKKEASKTPNRWEEIRAAARARKAELRSNLYSDVVLIKAASMAVNDVIIGATYIAEGVTKFADWVVKMRGEDINLTDDEMQQLFKESKAFDSGEELPVSDTALKTRKAKAPAIDKVKAIAADEEALDSRTIYNLVVEKVTERSLKSPNAKTSEMTDKDLEAILREVTEEVREYFPNVTEREIRDLFSGYGRIILPSQDDIRKQTRQLSALGKLASAIEDAKAQRAPLKSGPQRDKATQAIRLKQKELARELRMMSVEYAAGEEQLRSPLDAMKARVNNQISDLDYEIRKGRKNRRPTPDPDPELKELISLRDELKRISDFVNAPAGPTFAELVEDEMKKLDKRIEVLQQALKSRQFMPKQDNRIYTEELQVKRDERDRLSKLVAKARKQALGDPRTQDEIDRAAIKDAQDAIVELNRKIAEKDFSKPERRTPTETAEYQRLINEKQALQKVLSSMRQEAEGRQGPTDEQRIKQATEAIDASIARMEKMISSGNIDAVKRVSKTPETPELAQKREMRKNLRKQLLKLRKLKRDALIDPIAKQIATDKKRIQTRMDKLKKRMDERDFSKPVKREKPTDPALLELLAKEEELKEKWGEMLLNHKLSQRSKSQKAWAAVFDLFSMGRFLKASTDLSAIANQGNFALFSHPVLSMRQLGGMWEAMKSDKNQKMLQAKIRELPEYKSGEMKRAGLYLAMDAGPNDPLQRQEEAMAARWVDKLPGLPGKVLRATSRAYTSYLDLIRVATYLSLKNNLVEGGWFMQPQETTPERLQSVASLINNGTGRGSLGTGRFGAGMNQAAPFLNTFMFAPRFAVSRFAMSLGVPLWTASKGTKRLIAIEYAKYLSGLATAMFLYSMLQDEDDKEMEFDPTSSDFGKVIFDNQRVDVMGGFQQPLVFLLRVLFGEYKNTKGELKALREKDRPLNLFRETPRTDKPKFSDRGGATVVGDFLRYKLSPTASLLLNTIEGKTPVGERTDLMSEIITMPVPLILGQLTETAKAQQEDPFMALLLSGSGIIGVRTSNQDPNVDKSKAKTAWEQLIDYTKYYSGVE